MSRPRLAVILGLGIAAALFFLALRPTRETPGLVGTVNVPSPRAEGNESDSGVAPTAERPFTPPPAIAALAGTLLRHEWRAPTPDRRERWSLWRTALPEAPWVVLREQFGADTSTTATAPEAAPVTWDAWAADRLLVAAPSTSELAAILPRLAGAGFACRATPSTSSLAVIALSAPTLDTPDVAFAALRARLPASVVLSRDWLLFPTATTPNDPRYPDQWALPRIGAPEAWDLGTGAATSPGASEVVIAIGDTGSDLNHSDLAPNVFTNPGEADALAANGVDDDGNGFVDDTRGWDWVAGDKTPQDSSGHGTSVAGLAAASGNNALGIAGTSWRARVLPLRIGTGTFPISAIIQGIDYTIDLRARHALHLPVLNLSLGGAIGDATPQGAPGDLLHAALLRARTAGLLVCAAAGNDARSNETIPFYPASYALDNIIAVAGTARPDALNQDTFYNLSNYGTISVDLAAPAVDLMTTRVFGGTDWFAGTSGATPLVSGAIALAVSQSGPLPYLEVRRALLTSTAPEPALVSRCATGGRLDVRALAQATRLAAWHVGHWGNNYATDPAASASADPDADGDTNLVEFLRGTSPLAINTTAPEAARREVITLATVAPEGDVTDFSYWRARTALHLPVLVQSATDLGSAAGWSNVTPLAVDVIETAANGDQRVRVRVARSGSDSRRFFRVIVNP